MHKNRKMKGQYRWEEIKSEARTGNEMEERRRKDRVAEKRRKRKRRRKKTAG